MEKNRQYYVSEDSGVKDRRNARVHSKKPDSNLHLWEYRHSSRSRTAGTNHHGLYGKETRRGREGDFLHKQHTRKILATVEVGVEQ